MTENAGLIAALEALGEVNLAYKQRIRDLELTVANQQKIIEEQRAEHPPEAVDGN